MTAAIVCSTFVSILTVIALFLVAARSFRNAERMALTLERLDTRRAVQLESVLNRLMTIKWEDFAAVQAIAEDTQGEFLTPEEQNEENEFDFASVRRIRRPGTGLSPEEEALLAEDFPVETGADR